ncbi:MAG TPA: M99 family metallo-carboxypeptidase C-terminal domain-containing protein [bacterium]|nr:M99 family metallo-carboxypeptidase C-terminal domain-containing protein [bacterium]
MIKTTEVAMFLISLIFIMFILTSFLFVIKRKKGILALIISLIYTFFVGYYIYLIFYLNPVLEKFEKYSSLEKIIITPEIEKKEIKNKNDVVLVLNLNGTSVKVSIGDEIEIKKNMTFTINDVEGIDKKNVKVNFIGFIGNPKVNDGQDMGYEISYKKIMKNKALDQKKEKFEIEIKKDDKKIGSVYINFID